MKRVLQVDLEERGILQVMVGWRWYRFRRGSWPTDWERRFPHRPPIYRWWVGGPIEVRIVQPVMEREK